MPLLHEERQAPTDQPGNTMNENQKKVTNEYRSNWDQIFNKTVQPEVTRSVRPASEEGGNKLDEDEMGAGV